MREDRGVITSRRILEWRHHPGIWVALGLLVGACMAIDPLLITRIEVPTRVLRTPWELPFVVTVLLPVAAGLVLLVPIWRREGSLDRLIWFLLVLSAFTPGVPAFLGIGGLAIGILLLLTRVALGWEFRVVPTVANPFMAAFFVAFLLSLIPIRDLGGWVRAMMERGVHILLFLFLVNTVRTRQHLWCALRYASWCAVATGLFAVAQFLLIWYGLTRFNLGPKALHFTSSPIGILPRVSALFSHPNGLGGTMTVFGLVILFLAVSPAPMSWLRRSAMLAGGALVVLGAMVSFSRGAWLAMAVGMLILPLLRRPASGLYYLPLLALVGGVGHLVGLVDRVWTAVLRINVASADFRYYVAELAMEAIRNHPLLGVGINRLEDYNNPFRLPAHNSILQAASEVGLPAGVLTVGFIVILFVRLLRAIRRASDPWDEAALKGLTLGLLGASIHAQFDAFMYAKAVWLYLALVESALLILGGRAAEPGTPLIFARSGSPQLEDRLQPTNPTQRRGGSKIARPLSEKG